MRRVLPPFVVPLALSAAAFFGMPAAGATAGGCVKPKHPQTTTDFPATRADFNPANNDVVISNGNERVTQATQADPNGNFRGDTIATQYRSNQGQGQPSGRDYTVSADTCDSVAIEQDNAVELKQNAQQELKPKGQPSGNFKVTAAQEVETHPNGQTKVENNTFKATCGGHPCT